MKRIMLLLDGASGYDRKLLKGLVHYSKAHGPWLFYRMSSGLGHDLKNGRAVIDWARKWKADAIVGRWSWDNSDLLSVLNIPVVLQNYNSRSTNFSNLTGDYMGTGVLAADYFAQRRYKHYAYFGISDVVWSEERLEGYGAEVEKNGGKLFSLMVRDAYKERDRVVAWLHSLPKSVALFACDDAYALFVTEICQFEGIAIPEDIAVLGVDNDDLLCHISDPPLSSIELDVEKGGYRLGEILDRQFKSKDAWSFNVVVNAGEIVERDSTKKHNISDPYVEKVVSFINDNYDQYITTEQIFSLVPLSRRSTEIRFRQEMGGVTVYQYLINCRMHHFAQLLSTTDHSMMSIAEMCGIINYPNISRTFKKIYGCAPTEYRRMKRRQ
ncbi:MAG: DNA-binding transcriptional regulator [Bacteroidales bacterium]|nr:DNA-binding transcriptional regulator [Candidatus Cryptobacteroides onthequi]